MPPSPSCASSANKTSSYASSLAYASASSSALPVGNIGLWCSWRGGWSSGRRGGREGLTGSAENTSYVPARVLLCCSFPIGFRASCGEREVAHFFPFPPSDDTGSTGIRGCDIARTLPDKGASGFLLCFFGRDCSSEGAFRFREMLCCGYGPHERGKLASQGSREFAGLIEGESTSLISAYGLSQRQRSSARQPNWSASKKRNMNNVDVPHLSMLESVLTDCDSGPKDFFPLILSWRWCWPMPMSPRRAALQEPYHHSHHLPRRPLDLLQVLCHRKLEQGLRVPQTWNHRSSSPGSSCPCHYHWH